MAFKKRMCKSLFILFISVLVNRIAGTSGSESRHEEDRNRSSLSNRDMWPSWFQRRYDLSTSGDRSAGSFDKKQSDVDRIRSRHEGLLHSRSRSGIRELHDALLRNLRNRNDNELALGPLEKADEKKNRVYHFGGRENSTLGKKTNEKSFSGLEDSPNGPRESKTLKPTTTTTSNATRTNRDSNADDKSEKLTAVAVAEYTGTRAVAYAGYHHHNYDFNPLRTRNIFTPGQHTILETSATPIYTKHHSGRRVCSRPTSMTHHHRSRQYRLMYTELSSSTFVCCPGWSQVSRTSYGCNRPTCLAPCLNGGVCGPHGKCNCPKAFTGTQCQTDVDECLTEKPCGQLCTNLPGSYECHCRYGFHLLPDGQSCRKNGSDGTALEARDLENDYGFTMSTTPETIPRTTPVAHDTENEVGEGNLNRDYDIILKRLTKLEKQIARGRKRDIEASEMSTKITQAIESVAAMRRAVDNVQLMQQEIYDMRGKVKQFELESRKLQHLTNRVADLETRLRLRCRSPIAG